MQAVGEDDDHLVEIRAFFLHPRDEYSLSELASLWRVSIDDAADICHDEIARSESATSDEQIATFRLPWLKAVDITFQFTLLRPFDIERALGELFLQVRSQRWMTIPVVVRLPRFVAEAFELNPSVLPRLALAHRIEQILLEFFTDGEVVAK